MTGKIKWFDITKGYGFIKMEDREVFFHKSDAKPEDLPHLIEDREVEFDLYETRPRCFQAKNITLS